MGIDGRHQPPPLGTSEFIATLNGENPQAILRVLKQFARTVRKDRRTALSLTAEDGVGTNDGYDDDDIENDSTAQPPAKKLKKDEEWKEDSKNYSVPFVGTSVATSDVADAIPGEWPTGLVKAYLEKSPLAVELTSDDLVPSPQSQIHRSLLRRDQGKLSRAIYKAALEALGELVTSSIPLRNLEASTTKKQNMEMNSYVDSSDGHKFLPVLLKNRLAGIVQLLNDETDNGRGKTGVYGGCGALAPPALRLLRSISILSTGTARLVARTLDEGLSEGVLRSLLRPGPPQQQTSEDQAAPVSATKESRVEGIRLATALLCTEDSAVCTYICTSGSKERKVKPGILFTAFREGLATHQQSSGVDSGDANYLNALEHLLGSVGSLLRSPQRSKTIGQRLLLELFARDPLNHLCELLVHAPAMSSEQPYQEVLGYTDKYEDLEPLKKVGVEARRLLFCLLGDSSHSPLLRDTSQYQVQDLVRVVTRVLNANDTGVQTRSFLSFCLKATPPLLLGVLRVLPFPDHKHVYSFVSCLNFVSTVLRGAPPPIHCLETHAQPFELHGMEDMVQTVFPLKFKRHVIAKAMQSGNSLVVLECLRLYVVALERLSLLKSALAGRNAEAGIDLQRFSSIVYQWMPDLKIILATTSRFDPFTGLKSSILVHDCWHRVVEKYVAAVGTDAKEASLDWTKLLPSADKFLQGVPLVQQRVLATLQNASRFHQNFQSNSLRSCSTILEIMLRTTSERVRSICRKIALEILSFSFKSTGGDCHLANHFLTELSWWIDSLSIDCLPEFCSHLQAIRQDSLRVLSKVGKAWDKSTIHSTLGFSMLMMAALSADESTHPFSFFVVQVTTRSLLYQRNPTPLAELIVHLKNTGTSAVLKSPVAATLVQYSKRLADRDGRDGLTALTGLQDLLKSCFSERSVFVRLCSTLSFEDDKASLLKTDESLGTPNTFEEALVLARLVVHIVVVVESAAQKSKQYWTLLRRVVSSMLKYALDREEQRLSSQFLQDLRVVQGERAGTNWGAIELMMTSYPMQYHEGSAPVQSNGEGSINLRACESRAGFLRLCFLGSPLAHEGTARVMSSLLNDALSVPGELTDFRLRLFNSFADYTIEHSNHEQRGYDSPALEDVCEAWWKLSDKMSNVVFTSHVVVARAHLSGILASALRRGDKASLLLEAYLYKHGEVPLLERCLFCIDAESTPFSSRTTTMLEALIQCNYRRMGPHFLAMSLTNKFPSMGAWTSGALDVVSTNLLQQYFLAKGAHAVPHDFLRLIIARATSKLSAMKHGYVEDGGNLLTLTMEAVRSAKIDLPLHDLSSEILNVLSTTQHKQDPVDKDSLTSLWLLGEEIARRSSRDMQSEIIPQEVKRRLSSLLLCKLSEWLLSMQKARLQQWGKLNMTAIVEKITSLLLEVEEYDQEVLESVNSSVLLKVCRGCLKRGIHGTSQDAQLAAASLKLVSVLLVKAAPSQSSSSLLFQHFDVPQPSEVFQMVTSHSKFSVMMARGPSQEDEDRVELVRLMAWCLALSPDDITLSSGVLLTLYGAFCAGMGKLDTATRQLLSFLQSNAPHAPFLDEIRWNACADSGSKGANRWAWLLDALDGNRVRDTIFHFPSRDTVDVVVNTSLCTLELEIQKAEEAREEEVGSTAILGSTKLMGEPSSTEQGRDRRYSPAFILSVVLGALDGLVRGSDAMVEEPGTQEKGNGLSFWDGFQQEESLVLLVKGLCEKGIAGLCLSSLSSQCETVRKLSSSILGLFVRASTSDEARGLSSWRERPQLAMLLKSVQRALVLKAASSGNTMTSTRTTPQLPPLVAAFLAKASLSITKPSDPLYVPMNRFFLKSDASYGAFQDTSRLPGFISLFCSSSDDAMQSRKERLWALQLLRDGFLDSSCYRLVVSCHAPELVLTAFENVRTSSFSEEMRATEQSLLLDVTRKFLDNGGRQASSHLLGKIGLLAWMRSLCTVRPTAEMLPTVRVRVAFCNLVCSAIRAFATCDWFRTDRYHEDLLWLVEPVLRLTLSKDGLYKGDQHLMASTCEVLITLRETLKAIRESDETYDDSGPFGISTELSLRFLKNVPHQRLPEAAASLSYLPLRLESSSPDQCDAYCSFLLNVNHSHEGCEDIQHDIRNRVALLLEIEV